ncbi:hypothetical protein MCOR27_001611 [Pyricularia oryzae]|uniref:Tho complex subunit 7 n=3 Tax=Pyricularia TaxID=48558 RepID=A0ABQ8NKU2_PYRGI|nr:hypothetical protein MCOR01_005849 [Pyricularia oryzae]KAI6298561.1 hypothetical protein MCOR33_005348 [Pyricularia grisea]KAH9435075.1 hypothetical protein MCOR02_004032 [Pyricularia oryzae]KAI6255270.1 hypothetical protein MCOR19_008244 [Pyricularia oryzae]KAI6280573.1 hypothetical protein MCOR26_003647 [Pyricularia oryzae]
MAPFQLLDPREEEELHKSRLLNIEEKPFKRITKRMQTLHAAARWGKQPTPANATTIASPTAADTNQNGTTTSSRPPTSGGAPPPASDELQMLRQELTLDFAAFDSTVARLQFLMRANEEERRRYGEDREQILAECEDVRSNTGSLRTQLDEARARLEQRKKFDVLAEGITSNRMLKSRADQERNLSKLAEECAQLQEEISQNATTLRERKDQFERIMDEAHRLRRQIRDENDEVDRREGMGDDEGGEADGHTPRPGIASGNATPLPHAVPQRALAASTLGSRTPARESPAPQDSLKPTPDPVGSFSQGGGRSDSQDGAGATPAASTGAEARIGEGEGEDIEMGDVGERQPGDDGTPRNTDTQGEGTPRIMVDGPPVVEEKMDTT